MPAPKDEPAREITFAQAIKEALAEELRRDPRVFMIGEDIAEAGTTFKVLNGLVDEFGKRASSTRRFPSQASRAWAWARR